eukprot:4462282-Ditylum_brightwellii.AAC.1
MDFCPHVINWLPDNKPTQIYVQFFQDAIYPLLSNKDLMMDKKLSFPDSTSPLSPDNNPVLSNNSVISQLHLGTWWSSS